MKNSSIYGSADDDSFDVAGSSVYRWIIAVCLSLNVCTYVIISCLSVNEMNN